MKIQLGPVGHFGLAVRDLHASARWWQSLFDLKVVFQDDAYVGLTNDDVDMEDPGDEIGPEAEGSSNMGLWFHDPDGYRWELSAQGGR